MSSDTQSTADRTTGGSTEEYALRSSARDALGIERTDRLATAAMVAGGALLALARRTRRRSSRSLAAGTGLVLLGLGARERLRGTAPTQPERPTPTPAEHPRGTAAEPDVTTETAPDEGRIQFTEEHDDEPRPKPDLDRGPHDPRVDRGGPRVTVDLSEAALADEASEATGPTTEQSFPTQTEDTEPDPSPPEDVSHVVADYPGPEEWRGNRPSEQPFGVHWHDSASDVDRGDADDSGKAGADDSGQDDADDSEQGDADEFDMGDADDFDPGDIDDFEQRDTDESG